MRKMIATVVVTLLMLAPLRFASAARIDEPRRIMPAEYRIENRERFVEYRGAHRMRTAGMALTITGIPLMLIATGAAVAASSAANTYDRDRNVTAAAITGALGASLLASGIPLWAVGQHQLDTTQSQP